MSPTAKYEIHAERNGSDKMHIATKYSLVGALTFAVEIMENWDYVTIHEREENSDVFKIVAALNDKGLFA
jgi:hypothetical protein